MEISALSDAGIVKEIGNRIKNYRISLNITQEKLSSLSMVSVSTIVRLERGEDVSFLKLIKILEALNLSDNLEALIPDVTVQPIHVVDVRKRATSSRYKQRKNTNWKWGDEL